MSGMCRGTLGKVQNVLGDPWGGSVQVWGPSGRYRTGRGTHPEVETGRGTLGEALDGSGKPKEVRDGSGDSRGSL